MDVFEAIAKRHSYRGPFTDQRIPRSDLEWIMQAGLRAPSAKNEQTTRFVIVDEPELVRRIAALHTTNKAFSTAQAFIACIVDVDATAVYEGFSFQVEDCATAAENILLAVTGLGYATVWIDGWLRLEKRAETIGALLGIPDTKRIRVMLPIGVPAEPWPPREKKPFEERAWFNRFGGGA